MHADRTDTPSDPSVERAALAGVTDRPLERRPRSWVWPVLVIVLTALAAGAAAWGWSMREERDELERRLFEARAVIDGMTADLAAADSILDMRPTAAELAPILAAPDAVDVPLSGPDPRRGRMLASDAGALLVAAGVPSLPAGQVYRFWRSAFGGPEWIADLGRAPEGYLMSRFLRADFLRDASEIGVVASSVTEDSLPPDPSAASTLRGEVPR